MTRSGFPHQRWSGKALLRGVLLVIIVFVAVLSVLYILQYDFDPAGQGAAPDGNQGNYKADILGDRAALGEGYVAAPRDVAVEVNKVLQFEIAVCGASAYRPGGMCTWGEPRSPGRQPRRSAVPQPVGAQIRVKLTSDANAEIESISSDVQPVMAPTDQAMWLWNIKPREVGSFRLTVTLTVLRENTEEALMADRVLATRMQVNSTSSYIGAGIANTIKDWWEIIVATSSAILALPFVRSLKKLLARKRKIESTPIPATATNDKDARPGE